MQRAESAYRQVLERYPGNAKLVKSYARFLEHVVNDPWKAAKFYAEADKLQVCVRVKCVQDVCPQGER